MSILEELYNSNVCLCIEPSPSTVYDILGIIPPKFASPCYGGCSAIGRRLTDSVSVVGYLPHSSEAAPCYARGGSPAHAQRGK